MYSLRVGGGKRKPLIVEGDDYYDLSFNDMNAISKLSFDIGICFLEIYSYQNFIYVLFLQQLERYFPS